MKGDKIYYYDRGSFYTLNRAYHKGSGLILPDYSCFVGMFPEQDIETDFIRLSRAGIMTLKRHYSCDGPSGPTFDTPSTLRTAFIHDGSAQLFRLKLLDPKWIPKAHDNLRDFGIEDGMWRWRANLWHSKAVQKGMYRSMTDWKMEKELVAP
jgi:hypothetical protein